VNAPETASGLTPADIGSLPANARVQQQAIVSRDVQDRERITLNGTAQFEPRDDIRLTVDGLYSRFDVESFDTQFSGFFSPPFINPQIDANGTVTSFSRPSIDFQNRNPLIAGSVGLSQNDNVLTSANRLAETYLIGGNLEWDVRENLSFNVDVSVSNATRDGTNPFVVLGALAPQSPLIQLPDDAEITTLTNIVGAQDTSIQRLHFVNVARSQVEDDIFEYKVGGDWDVDKGPLATVSFGAAFSDREKLENVFDNFSPTQGGGIFCAFCGYTVDFDDNILTQVNLDGFLSGVDGSDRIPVNFLTATFEDAFAQLNSDAAINDPARTGSLPAADLIARRNAAGDSIFGFFTPDINPGASFRVEETVTSFFVNTAWEGDFGGELPWSANIGFRIAETDTSSFGVDQPVLDIRESPGDTQLVFQFGPTTNVRVDNSYTSFLPSANLKLETSEDTVLRFAVSETLTRPTLTSLGVNNSFGGRSNAPISSGGNPNLEAFESTNYDAAFEWYIDDISFFGLSAFHKSFSNFLESATLPVSTPIVFPAGNGGRTVDEVLNVDFLDTRTRNGETGSITGLEVALQKGFDNGFGAGVNYTYVTSNIDRALGSTIADLDYNGLSPHSLNANVFYEQGPWQARIAYNFRDEFLVQASSDQGEPRERESFGQFDFSAAYEINEQFQVFAEGINVFDADTRDFSRFRNRFLTFEDTGSRFTLGVRGKF